MISTAQKWLLAGGIAAAVATPALAGSTGLPATVRDFEESHSDFQTVSSGGPIEGMVKDELSQVDNKPILNVPPFGFYKVVVTSEDYDLSNVVLHLESDEDDDYVEFKYDGLSAGDESDPGADARFRIWDESDGDGNLAGKRGEFWVPTSYVDEGYDTIATWVKAGPNSADDDDPDGPGYGSYVRIDPDDDDKTHTTTYLYDEGGSHENEISVKFYYYQPIPAAWGIASSETFDQWFRTTRIDGEWINKTVPYRMVFERESDDFGYGGVYTFEARPFYPVDGQLFGEGEAGHNHHFTLELVTELYCPEDSGGGLFLDVSGNDDIWVFIAGELVADLGGVRENEAYYVIDVDALGLEEDAWHDLRVFYANRYSHTPRLRIQTNLRVLDGCYD